PAKTPRVFAGPRLLSVSPSGIKQALNPAAPPLLFHPAYGDFHRAHRRFALVQGRFRSAQRRFDVAQGHFAAAHGGFHAAQGHFAFAQFMFCVAVVSFIYADGRFHAALMEFSPPDRPPAPKKLVIIQFC
ncbi:MAG TPA: hypothetical protein VGX48_21675, partial [Pyrinomonadaceae bacterium]|nr:hypothetical protein [Pyrinomonadaceae bacterium]